MRRLLFFVFIAAALLWCAVAAFGQQQPVFPRHPTAPLTCNAASRGFAYHNTTDGKPWECTASGWTDLTATVAVDTAAVEAALPVSDATALVKGSGDGTKRARLEVDGLSGAVTRVITVPDANTSLPIASQILTFSGPSAPRTVTLPDASFTVAGLGTGNAFTGTNSFVDGNLSVVGSGDPSKILKLEADSAASGTSTITVTASTTVPIASQPITLSGPSAARTVTLPDSNFTVAGLGVSQTFSGTNLHTGREDYGTAADAVDAVALNETAGQITWEGAAADTAEHRLTATVNAGFDTITSIPAAAATQTVAILQAAQTFTVGQAITGYLTFGTAETGVTLGGSGIGTMQYDSTQTPDAPIFGIGTTANAFHFMEIGDHGFDFNNGHCASSACADPTVFVHSAQQNDDQFIAILHNQTQPIVRTAGNSAGRPVGLHGGTAVASAGTITPTGNVFHVTGTTNITVVTAMGSGTTICMIFDGALTVTDNNGALDTAGNFVTTANDTLCLVSDGTNWYETSRAVN